MQQAALRHLEVGRQALEFLREQVPEVTYVTAHGQMAAGELDDRMNAFYDGKYDVLLATTIVESGLDIPTANTIIMNRADRFGLAQLHQLRGRVGRGNIESHCVLLYRAPLGQQARQRLEVMRETTDGFRIAQKDLEIRGPGEVLGTRQTGEMQFRIADLVRDGQLLAEVQQSAEEVLRNRPQAVEPLIQRWIGEREQYGGV